MHARACTRPVLNVIPRVYMCILACAFGDSVDQLPPDLENARRARERLTARGPQKGGLEIRGDPRLAGAAARDDGQPDRHVRGGHECRPTEGAAGALELGAERRLDGALAGAEPAQSESEVRVERSTGEPALQLGPAGRGCHPSTGGRHEAVRRYPLTGR
jgi:hypothetical protein